MKSVAVISGVYLVAAFLVNRYFLPFGRDQRPRGLLIIPTALFYLLWPLWLPFAAYYKWQAYRAKPLYLAAVREFSELVRRERELVVSTDALVERLSSEDDRRSAAIMTQELGTLIEERAALQGSALPRAKKRVAAIYSRHYSAFSTDARLPQPPHWNPQGDARLLQLPDEDRVSRLRLGVNLDHGVLSASSFTETTTSLEEHLFGAGVLTNFMGTERVLYRRHAQKVEPRSEWTLVFSSAFKKSVKRVGKALQHKANEAIAQLLVDPVTPRGDTVARLGDDKTGLWRYRVGDYRLIYIPRPKERQIFILKLAHRGEAYR